MRVREQQLGEEQSQHLGCDTTNARSWDNHRTVWRSALILQLQSSRGCRAEPAQPRPTFGPGIRLIEVVGPKSGPFKGSDLSELVIAPECGSWQCADKFRSLAYTSRIANKPPTFSIISCDNPTTLFFPFLCTVQLVLCIKENVDTFRVWLEECVGHPRQCGDR